MKNEIPIERKLVFHFPELNNNESIPLNYQYAINENQ